MGPPSGAISDESQRLLVFGHRGSSSTHPENTLPAFLRAAELEIDFVETDLQITRDGQLVLLHDATLERTTNGRGKVEHHTLEELRQLDAGYHFKRNGEYPFRGQGITIPTLAELAEACPNVQFNIDLKSNEDSPKLLLKALDDLQLRERVIIASSSMKRIQAFRELAGPDIRTSASAREALGLYLKLRLRLRPGNLPFMAVQVPPQYGPLHFDHTSFIERCHRAGVEVHFWTVNQPEQMRALLSKAADGLMTDDPALLLQTLRKPT